MPRMEISGGASAREAVAIAAVVARVLEEEQETLGSPGRRPQQSLWVLSGRPRDVTVPLGPDVGGPGHGDRDEELEL